MPLSDRIVLIGDPDHMTSALYERTLRESFDVIVATDDETALRLLHTAAISVFVLELTLFGECNWEQLTAVGQLCVTRGIHLVICSTLDERRRGIEIGAAAYLIKPTLPSVLKHTVDSIVGISPPAEN